MKNIEKDFLKALQTYRDAREHLEFTRQKVLEEGFSPAALKQIAAVVADMYKCHWYITSEGGVSFCDDLSEPRATRRDDARKYWRRTIVGLAQ